MTDAATAPNNAPWMNNDRGVRRFGYSVVLIVALVIGVWGGIAPLESASLAQGVVQVEGKRKAVQHLEGGIIAEILVSNGEFVEQGQPVVNMDATQFRSELRITEGRLFNSQAMVDRLIAERDDQNAITFRADLRAASREDQRAASAIAGEEALFAARKTDIEGEAEVLEQRISQLQQQVKGLRALRDSNQKVADSLDEEIADLNALLREGYVDKQRLRELERSRSRVLGELSDIDAKIAGAEVSIGETRLQIIQLNKRFKTEVVDLLQQAQEQLYDLEQQYATTSDRVARSIVRAPARGYVLGLSTTTVGAVIGGGQEIMQIVPDVDTLVIDAQVTPLDIDRIKVGQEAEIRFSVFKDAYSVTGRLEKVSADRLIDEATGAPYYAAEVHILEEDMSLLEGMELIPGMPAEVLIKTGERTMLGYITSPLKRLFANSLIED